MGKEKFLSKLLNKDEVWDLIQIWAKKIRENFDGVLANFFRGQEEIEVVVRNDPESLSMASINFSNKIPQEVFWFH